MDKSYLARCFLQKWPTLLLILVPLRARSEQYVLCLFAGMILTVEMNNFGGPKNAVRDVAVIRQNMI
jgi:hypothetical protein